VEQVTWHEATEFCRLATERTRRQFRLPTEAEWEFACRAGSTGRYCFGSDETGLGDYAWFRNNSGGQTHPVGQKKPNAWGLHDVHGNVWEWVADWYAADYYANSPHENPTGPDTGNRRLLRGGSWGGRGDPCHSSLRYHHPPLTRVYTLGFRAVASVPGPAASDGPGRAQAVPRKPPAVKSSSERASAPAAKTPEPKLALSLQGVRMEFIYIAPGAGIEKGFYLGKTEVTVALFAAFVAATRYKTDAERYGDAGVWSVKKKTWLTLKHVSWKRPGFVQGASSPVVCVSRGDAIRFCEHLSKAEGMSFRLPTEAEWEYACRAGRKDEHWLPVEEHAWSRENSNGRTHAVASKRANPFGLYDMLGNAWEICADRYPAPQGWKSREKYVARGGSWVVWAGSCLPTSRSTFGGIWRDNGSGFRVALDLRKE
jgi:formylglycine-generating enzyme required for sulfatase activity